MKKILKIISVFILVTLTSFNVVRIRNVLGVEVLGLNDILESNELNLADNDTTPKVENEILFLVMGIDAENNGDKVRNGIRSDTIFLCKANTETGEISLLQFPRDTRVPVRGKLDKLNHSHAYGGSALVIKTLRDFTGLDIDYYVKVNYKVVKDVVDSIGGVKINVSKRMKYDDPTAEPPLHIDLSPGEQVLDGQKAIEFLRWRKNNNSIGYENGDLGRIETQQYFMKELTQQVTQPRNVLNISKLIKSGYDNIDTNIPLLDMLLLAKNYNKFDFNNIKMETIDGKPQRIDGLSYYIPNKEWLKDKINTEYSEYKNNKDE